VIQLRSGLSPLHRHDTASTSIGNVGRPRMRPVCRSESTRSAQRLPVSLQVPLTPLPPSHPEAVGAFRHVVCAFAPWHGQKYPERLAFPLQTPGKRPGLVLAGDVLVHKRVATRIPRPPLSHRWALRTHMTQPLQLSVYAPSKGSKTCVHVPCQPCGRADQMRHAALSSPLPGVIEQIPIAGSVLIVEIDGNRCQPGPGLPSISLEGAAHDDMYRGPMPSLSQRSARQPWQNRSGNSALSLPESGVGQRECSARLPQPRLSS
jgi:hypothetical protein